MPSSAAAGANGSVTTSIGPCVARMTAMSRSDSSIASGSLWSTASATAASASVPFSISRSIRILNSRSVGSWRTDSAPVRRCSTSSVPVEPERRAGLGRDREPDVEVVVAEVVVRHARVRVDDLRRAPGVLGVDPRRHQHRAVAEHARVEDRRDLADDPLVHQPLGSGQNLVLGHARQAGHVRVRALRDREAALEQVQEPLVELVERDRGAVPSAPNLRYRLSHRATSFAW